MGRGRKKKPVATVHAQRLHLLILELVREVGSQAEVARQTGLGGQYVGQMFNLNQPDAVGAKGVSADIIQRLYDKLGLDPMFFFDRWRDGEKRSYKRYSKVARHHAATAAGLAQQMQSLTQQLQDVTQRWLEKQGAAPPQRE